MLSCKSELHQHEDIFIQLDKVCIHHHFSGSVLVAYEDSILFDQAYGYTDENKTQQNNQNTIYPIASVTKLFIKHAILQMVEEGLLSIDDSMSEHLKGMMYGDEIKISQLLYHQSGLPDIHNRIARYDNPWLLHYPIKLDALLDSINSFEKLDFKPGSQSAYSNSNYLILARIIENISHQSLDDYLQEKIFKPFQLQSTGLYKEHSHVENHAKGYSTQNGSIVFTPDFNFRNFWGSGNAFSSTHDLYQYYLNCNQYLSANISQQLVQHSGLYTGYRSYYKVVPEIGLAIIILSNNGDFKLDLMVNLLSDYFNSTLWSENRDINSGEMSGTYQASRFQEEIVAKIAFRSHKYYFNDMELVQIKENVFMIPNSGFTVLNFLPSTKKMILNDNGILWSFTKIE